jgi:hypothetical protein
LKCQAESLFRQSLTQATLANALLMKPIQNRIFVGWQGMDSHTNKRGSLELGFILVSRESSLAKL